MKHIKRFILNGLTLCAVSLVMRTVGVSFQAYVSGRAGAEAMGLYSLLSGIYGFAITLATSGVGLATTRLVSEALGKNDPAIARLSLRRAVVYSLAFGGLANLLLFALAAPIGSVLLGDERTVLPLKILSFSLIPISVTSAFNGYFTAIRKVYKNAIIQLLEQGVRIFAVSRLLTLLLPRGIAYACAALAIGGMLSEIGSFLLSLLALLGEDHGKPVKFPTTQSAEITKKLCGIALPVAFSAYARSGLLSIEHMLIPVGLRKSGSSQSAALASYGTLASMVMPILLFPSAFISSFSGLLVPELAECAVQNNKRQIQYISERVIQLSLLFSIGVSGIMICFATELGELIYPGKNTQVYIRMLAPLIPVMYLDTSVDAMLKGLGEQVFSMGINIADSLLSIALVWFLLPKYGIMGYVLTIYIAELFNASTSITRLIQKSGLCPNLKKWLFTPLLSIIGATSISNISIQLIHFASNSSAIQLILHILVSLALYLLLLFFTNGVDKEDLAWFLGILKKSQKEI